MRRVVLAALAAWVVFGGGELWAQRSAPAAGGVVWETYRFGTSSALDIESLSLLTVPLAVQAGSGRWRVRVTGAFARGTLARPDGTESEISGLTDTELSVQYEVSRHAVTLTGIAVVPTGRETLTFEEMYVAGAIAADLLPFRITNWGTGGGAGLGVTITRPLGAFAAGLTAGYVVARTFQPLDDETFEYRPGNQLQVRGAIDRVIGGSGKAALQAGYERFGADQGEGSNLFQAGDRLHLTGSYDFALGSSGAVAYAGWSRRGDGEYAEPQELLPATSVVFAGLALRSPLGGSVVQPSADVRLLDSEGADRHGYTVSAGASLETHLAGATLVPTLRARFGRIEARNAAETGFTGAELGFVLRSGR